MNGSTRKQVPDPTEVCTIVVNGVQFDDWETVYVRIEWGFENNGVFRFTCAEREPMPPDWRQLQFKPGDYVWIYLAGIPALAGVITIRQAGYDADNHTVMLFGHSIGWWAMRASVDHPTGSFDGKSFVQIAKEVLAPTQVPVRVVGEPDPMPFKYAQSEPGETNFQLLDRLSRMRGAILGTDATGAILLIGQHKAEVLDGLIEGENILRAQGIIDIEGIWQQYVVRGQSNSDDQTRMADANEIEAKAPGGAPRPGKRIWPAEGPLQDQAEAFKRVIHEQQWHEATIVTAIITVQGWLSPKGDLWRVGKGYYVYSPMLMLNEPMGAQVVTYTQSREAGTLTTLEMVRPGKLKMQPDYSGGLGGGESTAPKADEPAVPPPAQEGFPPAPPTLEE